MPFVNIKLIPDGLTPEKKARLIKGVTDLLATELGKNPASTFVVIEEISADNFGLGGETVAARLAKK